MSFISPHQLHKKIPISKQHHEFVQQTRQDCIKILNNQDDRLVIIIGPCSIHDQKAALLYAEKLHKKIQQHKHTLCIIMRTYLEKARTNIGWKGFINDPDLNGSFAIEKGLQKARSLLRDINSIGVPTAIEILNPLSYLYFMDLTSWAAIGARTTESQIHRELASALSLPIGFKNNTSGDIKAAIDGIQTAREPHHFLGIDLTGQATLQQSLGNPYCHVILRGSHHCSNYDDKTINETYGLLKKFSFNNHIMIDCSHGNSHKNHHQQIQVLHELCERIKNGDRKFFGIMLESYLQAGKQLWQPLERPHPEISITDACIGWQETEMVLDKLSAAVEMRRGIRCEV